MAKDQVCFATYFIDDQMTTIILNTNNLFISKVTNNFSATSAAIFKLKTSSVKVDHISNQNKSFLVYKHLK